MNILVISGGFLLFCRFWEVFALFLSFLGSWGEYFDHFGNFIDVLFSSEDLEYFCHLKISRGILSFWRS